MGSMQLLLGLTFLEFATLRLETAVRQSLWYVIYDDDDEDGALTLFLYHWHI